MKEMLAVCTYLKIPAEIEVRKLHHDARDPDGPIIVPSSLQRLQLKQASMSPG